MTLLKKNMFINHIIILNLISSSNTLPNIPLKTKQNEKFNQSHSSNSLLSNCILIYSSNHIYRISILKMDLGITLTPKTKQINEININNIITIFHTWYDI